MNANTLGIYEKALPKNSTWEERFHLVKELGFDFLEFSIDESDERLERLEWSSRQRNQVVKAFQQSDSYIHNLMLSGHRRYPLGSVDPTIRKKALDIMEKALRLAVDLNVRNIQLAGYDVFYEPRSILTREYFMENLAYCVDRAASQGVMLSIETMDDPFINSITKIQAIKEEIKSPWLQAYPDLGNLTAWPENDVARELEQGIETIAAIHLKDTLPVTSSSKGQFKDVPFGKGTVDFEGCLKTLKRLGYSGSFTIEMWSETSADPIKEVQEAKQFFDGLFQKLGMIVGREDRC